MKAFVRRKGSTCECFLGNRVLRNGVLESPRDSSCIHEHPTYSRSTSAFQGTTGQLKVGSFVPKGSRRVADWPAQSMNTSRALRRCYLWKYDFVGPLKLLPYRLC